MERENAAGLGADGEGIEDGLPADEELPALAKNRDAIRKARIKDVVIDSHGIATIELSEMIIAEPGDDTEGADSFEELFSSLRDESTRELIKPAFLWAGASSTSLIRAIRSLREKNQDLLEWIMSHASYADLSSPNGTQFLVRLKDQLRRPGSDHPLALTVSRCSEVGQKIEYDAYYGQSSPSRLGSKNPCCEQISSPGKWMDEVVREMYKYHEINHHLQATSEKNQAFQGLDRIGISVQPLREFLSEI